MLLRTLLVAMVTLPLFAAAGERVRSATGMWISRRGIMYDTIKLEVE